MNETMLALLGFATTILIIVVLLKNWTTPSLAFIGVSVLSGLVLILTGTFTIEEVGNVIEVAVVLLPF